MFSTIFPIPDMLEKKLFPQISLSSLKILRKKTVTKCKGEGNLSGFRSGIRSHHHSKGPPLILFYKKHFWPTDPVIIGDNL